MADEVNVNEQQHRDLYRWLSAIAADVIDQFVGRPDRGSPAPPADRPDAWDPSAEWRGMQPHLASVSPLHREALELRLRDGLSYAEIALRLGVPEGTIHSRLARARGAIASRMDGAPPFGALAANGIPDNVVPFDPPEAARQAGPALPRPDEQPPDSPDVPQGPDRVPRTRRDVA